MVATSLENTYSRPVNLTLNNIRAVTYPLVLLLALGAVVACGPRAVPNYLKDREALLQRVVTEEELGKLKKSFDQNPEQYSQHLFDASLARMHQVFPAFADEFAQIPEVNNGISPAKAEGTYHISERLSEAARRAGGIPPDIFEENREVVIEWRGYGAKKGLWEFEIGASDPADASYMGRVLSVEPIGFEQGEDAASLEDGVLKVRSLASSSDTDGLRVSLDFPASGRAVFVLNKNLVSVSYADFFAKDQVVLSEKYDLEGVVTVKSAADLNSELLAIRDMVLAGEGDHKFSAPMQALLWGYLDGHFKAGSGPFGVYKSALEFVRPIWGEMEGKRWKKFEDVTTRLNDPRLLAHYIDKKFTYTRGPIDGFWEHAGPTFSRKNGHCIALALFGEYCLKKAGYRTFIRSVDFPGEPCCSDHTGSGIISEDGKYLVVVDFGLRGNRMGGPYEEVSQVDRQLAHGRRIIRAIWGHKISAYW